MEEYKVSLGLAIGNHENWYHDNKNKSHVQLHMLFPPKAKEENYIKSDEYQRKRSKSFPSDDYIMKERDEDGGSRKKLKLSEDQTTLLEETFQDHNTLNTIEKHELADKLKLKPRQVEVWFQNRRARDKLKQTEREFQQLKRWCETLSEENQMLKKELHELTRKQIEQ